MAYLRKEKHVVEIDYPLIKVWKGIPKVLEKLNWKLEKKDKKTHQIKANTQAGLLSYASMLFITVWTVDEKTTRVKINAETPVTTITSLADFGRIRDRIELFFETLSKQLVIDKETNKPKSEK
jgi:hypothetical protein